MESLKQAPALRLHALLLALLSFPMRLRQARKIRACEETSEQTSRQRNTDGVALYVVHQSPHPDKLSQATKRGWASPLGPMPRACRTRASFLQTITVTMPLANDNRFLCALSFCVGMDYIGFLSTSLQWYNGPCVVNVMDFWYFLGRSLWWESQQLDL